LVCKRQELLGRANQGNETWRCTMMLLSKLDKVRSAYADRRQSWPRSPMGLRYEWPWAESRVDALSCDFTSSSLDRDACRVPRPLDGSLLDSRASPVLQTSTPARRLWQREPRPPRRRQHLKQQAARQPAQSNCVVLARALECCLLRRRCRNGMVWFQGLETIFAPRPRRTPAACGEPISAHAQGGRSKYAAGAVRNRRNKG